MRYEQLWAPWRLAYIQADQSEGESQPTAGPAPVLLEGADASCFICRAVADDADRQNLVVGRGRQTVVVLNRYPYNNGHLMVAPQRHLGRLENLSDEIHLEAMQVVTRLVGLIERLMSAEGFNIGLNLGKAAGAGLPGHLHWHVVPRWSGDTNFMPVFAGVKVIPQSLDALWELLAAEWGPVDARDAGP